MGDNVYGDTEDGLLNGMKSSYKKQKQMFPDWLLEKKLNAIWDDHDYGKNDGGVEYPLKDQAQKLFLEFWNVDKKDPRTTREGIYFNEATNILGRKVNLIALDTRYHRSPLDQADKPYSPTEDTSKTILGEDQWEWLSKVLKLDSDLIIVVSSIQVLPTNHVFEKWHNFPHERDRLLKLLKITNKPVVILSGDRHKAGLYEQGNIVEMTSSSLNKPISRPLAAVWDIFFKETDELLIDEMYYQENYGILNFTSKGVSVSLKNLEGETVIYKEI
jgi:alkaline phosphatase D